MSPSERTLPVLLAIREGNGWRMDMPGGTTAWLPTWEACLFAAKRIQAAVKPVELTESELRALAGDR